MRRQDFKKERGVRVTHEDGLAEDHKHDERGTKEAAGESSAKLWAAELRAENKGVPGKLEATYGRRQKGVGVGLVSRRSYGHNYGLVLGPDLNAYADGPHWLKLVSVVVLFAYLDPLRVGRVDVWP